MIMLPVIRSTFSIVIIIKIICSSVSKWHLLYWCFAINCNIFIGLISLYPPCSICCFNISVCVSLFCVTVGVFFIMSIKKYECVFLLLAIHNSLKRLLQCFTLGSFDQHASSFLTRPSAFWPASVLTWAVSPGPYLTTDHIFSIVNPRMDLNLSLNETAGFRCKLISDRDVNFSIQCVRVIPWTLRSRQNSMISRLL